MNEKKICFIMCCNNDYYVNECKLYLEELVVPEGYEVDMIEVRGANSMAAGCNEGMQQSDAKYKVYIHQDVFITHKEFLIKLLELFQRDEKIGLIGMVGTPYLVKDATMWHGIRYGGFYKIEEYLEKSLVKRFFPLYEGYMEVEAVDGLLIATQYDLPWREDIFKKWDFYDISQSFEYLKAGYKVVVPGQAPEWYIHDCGVINMEHYDEEKDKFLSEYSDFMNERKEESWEEYLDKVSTSVIKGFHGPKEELSRILAYLDGISDE